MQQKTQWCTNALAVRTAGLNKNQTENQRGNKMQFVEYKIGLYVNIECVNWISVKDGVVRFTTIGDSAGDDPFEVDDSLALKFLGFAEGTQVYGDYSMGFRLKDEKEND